MAIVGWTAIEELLKEGLAGAFDGSVPKELRSFRARAAVAEALGLLPSDLQGPLGEVKRIRDEFAHAKRHSLTASDSRVLYKAMREVAPDVDRVAGELKNEEPSIVLSTLLLLLQEAMLAAFDDAAAYRAQREDALRDWWQRRALSSEQIIELLRNVDPAR